MIEEKSNILDKQIEKLETRYGIKEIISLLCATMCTSFGVTFTIPTLILGGSLLPCGLLAITAGVSLFHANRSIAKRKKHQLAKLKQERKHLEKVKNEGLNLSKEINNKRMKKIKELRRERQKAERSMKDPKKVNIVSMLGMGVSALASTTFPVISLIMCMAFATGKVVASSYITKKTEEVEKLNNRIDNLSNDLEIASVIGSRAQITPVEEESQAQENQDSKQKVREIEQITYAIGDEQMYTSVVEQDEESVEKPLQKVKQ